MRVMSPGEDEPMDLDLPPSSDMTPSESDFSRVGSADLESNNEFSQPASSGFSIVSRSQIAPERMTKGETHLQALASLYTRHSTATELYLKVVPPVAQQTGTGRGTLIIPGWIRERGAEVLFEGGDVDESSVAETILDSLLKVASYTILFLRLPTLITKNRRSQSTSEGPLRPPYSSLEARQCSQGSYRASTSSSFTPLQLPRRRPRAHPCAPAACVHRHMTAMHRCALSSRSLLYSTIHLRDRPPARPAARTREKRPHSRLRLWRGLEDRLLGRLLPPPPIDSPPTLIML